MKAIEHWEAPQRLGHWVAFGVGRTLGLALIAVLFVAWVLTDPFFLLARRIREAFEHQT